MMMIKAHGRQREICVHVVPTTFLNTTAGWTVPSLPPSHSMRLLILSSSNTSRCMVFQVSSHQKDGKAMGKSKLSDYEAVHHDGHGCVESRAESARAGTVVNTVRLGVDRLLRLLPSAHHDRREKMMRKFIQNPRTTTTTTRLTNAHTIIKRFRCP